MDKSKINSLMRQAINIFPCLIVSIFTNIWTKDRIYHQMYEIFFQRSTLLYRLKHGFIVFIAILFIMRLLFTDFHGYVLKNNNSISYDFLPFFISAISDYNVESNIFSNIFMILIAFMLIVQVFFYFTPVDNISWYLYRDGIVILKQVYDSSKLDNVKLKNLLMKEYKILRLKYPNKLIPDKIINLIAQAKINFTFSHVDQNLIKAKRLGILPEMKFRGKLEGIIILKVLQSAENICSRGLSKKSFEI